MSFFAFMNALMNGEMLTAFALSTFPSTCCFFELLSGVDVAPFSSWKLSAFLAAPEFIPSSCKSDV
jgi:hypothetical protein